MRFNLKKALSSLKNLRDGDSGKFKSKELNKNIKKMMSQSEKLSSALEKATSQLEKMATANEKLTFRISKLEKELAQRQHPTKEQQQQQQQNGHSQKVGRFKMEVV
ncbi:hypothetical protein CHISP_1059 [Chitinispirillum alkaliphilum]|nr:hypothetical protein CHISP_1059 [Chitinispirillum alkaliphilum]